MRDHGVQLYQEEEDLAAALARFAGAGLALGQGVVFLGSPARWQATMEQLRGAGVDTHNAVLRGQLRLFGSRVVLSSCMSHGVPERRAFNESIAGIFALMRMRYPVLRVFGGLTDEAVDQRPAPGGQLDRALLERARGHAVGLGAVRVSAR